MEAKRGDSLSQLRYLGATHIEEEVDDASARNVFSPFLLTHSARVQQSP